MRGARGVYIRILLLSLVLIAAVFNTTHTEATEAQGPGDQKALQKIIGVRGRPIIGSLPYRHLNYPSRQPEEADPLKPAYKGADKPAIPEDLKAPITKDITDLAETLKRRPVAIYEYVKNNIETEWYWGCMKGAEETLRQKSGNDCDQATLLIALLRASGFPARYVRGTIEYFAWRDAPIEKIKNLTGIEDPSKIAELFQKAGIPFQPVITGGKITNIRAEHIWVESEIPYANYRGTLMDGSGKRWLGLDTSVKVKYYQYNNPADIFGQSGGQLRTAEEEYLDKPRTETPVEYLKTRISALSGQPADSYRLTRTLPPENMKILPSSMQIEQKVITHEYAEIPDELKHKIRFVAPGPLLDVTLDASELSNRQIAIAYEPETIEDQEIIDFYGGLDKTPIYLIRLRPVLRVDGKKIVEGTAGLPMGADYDLTVELLSPNSTERVTNTHIAGNLSVMAMVSQRAVSSQPSPDQLSDAEAPEHAAQTLLYREAVNFIDRWNQAEDELASLLHLTVIRPVPTVVTVGSVVDVQYSLDMPRALGWKGIFIDANLRAVEVIPCHMPLTQGEDEERQRAFMKLSSLQGSVLEHRVFEDDLRVESISTAKLFQLSKSAPGTQLLTIDKTNISSILPTLTLDGTIKEDITNAVNRNLIVRIPTQPAALSYLDWTGAGYIREDPETGESGWMLSGLIAGGMTAVSPDRWTSPNIAYILGNPYTKGIVPIPLRTALIFPFDGAAVSVSPIDVEGLVSDPTASVTVNGLKASVSKDGRFIARGIALTEGTNLIKVEARDLMGQSNTLSITVSYQISQSKSISVSIISPQDGGSISRPSITVRGRVVTEVEEVWVKVNGLPAEVYGDQFVINDLQLLEGGNTITVNALDSIGSSARAEITVKADTKGPHIRLSANITSGIPVLKTYFSLMTALPNPAAAYQMDFEGDGKIDYEGDAFEDVSYAYATEGIYYPTVTVTDDKGNIYTDSIAVTVLNREKMDALLKGKWEGMKRALAGGSIEGALKYFAKGSRQEYGEIFELLAAQLPVLVPEMREIDMVYVTGNVAEYYIKRFQRGVDISYFFYFVKDADGIWKIERF